MLSDEEKKAIDWFREDLAEEKENYGKYNDYKKQVIRRNERLLNLIEKQSKEIEENKKYIDLHYVPYEQYTSKLNELNKKWKDKIKAKIEEVKDGTFDAEIVLQSLLEKE